VAKISVVLCTSHSPFLFTPPEDWNEARAARAQRGAVRADVPQDSLETDRAKAARCTAAFAMLRRKLEEAAPDVLLIVGDDQGEQFHFDNFPAFGIFLGEEFEGYRFSKSIGLPIPGVPRPERPKTPENWARVKAHPRLAKELMVGLIERGFDLAFSLELGDKEEGMGHAFMRPSHYLRPKYDLPTIPFFVNCYYGPQPTGRRCYELGRAIRATIEASSLDLKIGVIGSGGLWHTPGAPQAHIDEAFDKQTLDAVRRGDARAMAANFDSRRPEVPSGDNEALLRASGGTGMLSGLGSGTGETRNWIAAAAVADGTPGTVVDYVPVYASPCGMAFAYWDRP